MKLPFRRERDESQDLSNMGKALGWDRTSFQGVQTAHLTVNKDKAKQGYYSKGAFQPGEGHVDDEVPHTGWKGITNPGLPGALPGKK
jgi:hypothetical protein